MRYEIKLTSVVLAEVVTSIRRSITRGAKDLETNVSHHFPFIALNSPSFGRSGMGRFLQNPIAAIRLCRTILILSVLLKCNRHNGQTFCLMSA